MPLRLIFIRFLMIYKVKKINNPHDIQVEVPGSKSITNRALLIAALSGGRSLLKGCLFSDDSRHFIDALINLGFPVTVDENKKEVSITGFSGKIPKSSATIDVGSAGTAARFLTAYLGLSKGRYRIVSSDQMKKRPMKELLLSLETLGARIEYEEEEYHFPFTIGNDGIKSNRVTVNVEKSSQFLSALLISSVLSKEDMIIDVVGQHGMAYVDMTVRMMREFGLDVLRPPAGDDSISCRYQVLSNSAYKSRDYEIEPDLSAACYFYAMSPVLGVKAQVLGVKEDSLQGDIRFLDLLQQMGCHISKDPEGLSIIPPESGRLLGGEYDLSAFSDQALTLAAIAPFAASAVAIKGISHIRYQECDRINAIIENLTAMGINAREIDGDIYIAPGQIQPALIKTYEDHRVAMAFTIPGLVTDGIEIENPMCCRKTFENYYDVIEALY